jgi:PGAP1-like protein
MRTSSTRTRFLTAILFALGVAAMLAAPTGAQFTTPSGSQTAAPAEAQAVQPADRSANPLATVTVTFDEYPAGTVLTNQYPGLTFSSAPNAWSGSVTGSAIIVSEPAVPAAGMVSCTSTSATSNGSCVTYAGPASNGICAQKVGGGADCRADVSVTFAPGASSLIYTVMGGYPPPANFEFYDMFGNTQYNTFSVDHVEPRLQNVWKQTINRTLLLGSSPLVRLTVSNASSNQSTKGMANTGGLALDTLVYNATTTCAMSISTTTVPDGVTGVAYSKTIDQTGGAAPVAFSVLSGTLPEGLALSSTGTISGIPTQVAPTSSFTVKAIDANSCIATKAYTANVIGPLEIIDPACSSQTNCYGEFVANEVALKPPAELVLAPVQRTGAVTDGVTRLVLRVRTEVDLTLDVTPGAGVPAGSVTKWDGTPLSSPITLTPDPTPSSGKTAFAVFTVPTGLDPAVASGLVTFALHTPLGGATVSGAITLKRPLPILVHGVWSGGSAWAGLRVYLTDHGYQVCADCVVEYGGYDGGAPTFNKAASKSIDALRVKVDRAIKELHTQGFAATQVDIVAHSMGGLVTRARAAQWLYKSRADFFRGTFHRVITVGTPHQGTPVANWIVRHRTETRQVRPRIGAVRVETVEEYVNRHLGTFGPGIYDMQTLSTAIMASGATNVEAHALVAAAPDTSAIETFLNDLPRAFNYMVCTLDTLLGGNGNHDTLVTAVSQRGGIAAGGHGTTPPFNDVLHAATGFKFIDRALFPTETNQFPIFARILALLRSPSGSGDANSEFAPGFSLPAAGPWQEPLACRSPSGARPAVTPVAAPTVFDITPAEGTVVHPGDVVAVTFTVTGGEPIDSALITIGGEPYRFDGSGPFTVPYEVPANRVGRIDVVAETIGPGAEDYSASTYLTVSTLAPLIGIAVSPNALTLTNAGARESVHVTASYNGGSDADVSAGASGTTYHLQSGNTAVASVDVDGTVEAHGNGLDTLVVEFGGFAVNVPVSVAISNFPPSLAPVDAITVTAGAIANVDLAAVDPDGDMLTLVGLGLPAFVSVVDAGGGIGQIHLAPTVASIGHYSIVVSAADDGAPPLESGRIVSVTVAGPPFTDDPLLAGQTAVKAVHVLELRARIDVLRARNGLSAFTWTDASLSTGVSFILAQHVVDLRAALADVYIAEGAALPTYTDPVLAAGMAIKREHISQIRAAILAIE